MAEGQILAFFVAITILTMAPGADTVMVVRNSIRGGLRDGAATSLGICTGLFVHASLSAGGLSLILLGSAKLFHAVKLVGAAYIIWLGVQNFRSAFQGGGLARSMNGVHAAFSLKRSLREGFLSNVLNPKTAVFYMAFLPQFMDPHGNLFAQSFLLAGIHFAIAMVWQCMLAAMVDKSKVFLSSPRVSRWMDSIVGSLLMALGIKLAMDDA